MKVYLCGGINGLSDADCNNWRDYAREHLKCETIDPMRRDYRGVEDQHIADIVAGDLADIDECDFVLANCTRPSWGTAMEIYYAWTRSKRIYAIVKEGMPISPWLRFHSTVLTSFSIAIGAINKSFESRQLYEHTCGR